jgi:hypothetical protein
VMPSESASRQVVERVRSVIWVCSCFIGNN